jgi:hypothetical protein
MKIGAILSAGQLEGYSDKLRTESNAQLFLLVSLHPLTGLPAPWTPVGLGEVANGMDQAGLCIEDPFQRLLVEHEASLLRKLVDLGSALDPVTHRASSWFLSRELQDAIKEMRAGTIVEKLRAGLMLNHLRQRHESRMFESAAGLTNGSGVVDFRRPLPDGRTVGWQLQGNQYRLFAESERLVRRGKQREPLGVTPGELSKISPWFNFDNARKVLPGLTLSGRASGQGVFGLIFAYQYLQLPVSTTNGQLVDLLDRESTRLGGF